MKTEVSPNLAEVEIIYKSKVNVNDRIKITRSADVYEALKNIYNPETVEHHEEFVLLLLNRALQVLGWAKISMGGITSTIVDTRIVFQYAIKANATGIMLSHNHPSGIVTPSEQDKQLTKKISEIGKLLEIQVLDHIIFTPDAYYSFADEGEI
ncbi:MAG: repair protein [Bacteroidetes bacterium]|jgi:DNA repair protein RadC|nr:repair protein [Bacteroidota bacterium]